MRRASKLTLIGTLCACAALVLLLTAAISVHLLANRQLVKSYIVNKTAQATGGHIDYDRMQIGFFPLPHLAMQNVHLQVPGQFSLQTRDLSVFPRLTAMLHGRLAVRRVSLDAPDLRVTVPGAARGQAPAQTTDGDENAKSVADIISSVFGRLAAIDQETRVDIDQGRVTVASPDHPDIQFDTIAAFVENSNAGLSLDLSGTSNLIKKITLQATASIARSQIDGRMVLTDIDPQPITSRLSLPAGIAADAGSASAVLDFTVDGPDDARCRFTISSPALVIRRSGRSMNFSSPLLSGELGFGDGRWSLHLDRIATRQPAFDLSANAILERNPETGRTGLLLSAGADQLDIATAADAALTLAGDQESIRTAFDVAKAGILAHPAWSAAFEYTAQGWRISKMKATGHLSDGRIRIPAINAEVAQMAGEIDYEGDHVAFKGIGGWFEGAAFKGLDIAMDWTDQATWSIAGESVEVDGAPFFTWLTGFEALAGVRTFASVIDGRATFGRLHISGPLKAPRQWDIDVIASPQDLVLRCPRTPFDIKLSGGEIAYRPDSQQSKDVGIGFLDASLVVSHRSSLLADTQRASIQADGSMGPEAVSWLGSITPVLEHLQVNPPVALAGVNLAWTAPNMLSVSGELKTAGNVTLAANLTYSPEKLDLHKLKFSDRFSEATLSASQARDASIELTFSGNVKKSTADRLFMTNQILSGDIEGDFRASIDADTPLDSTFAGRLNGNGLHLAGFTRVPITVSRFSLVGHGSRLDILPSEVTVDDMTLRVDGRLTPGDEALLFDINVDSDRLDMERIRSLKADSAPPPSGQKEASPPAVAARGTIHVTTDSLAYGGHTWSQVAADIRVEPVGAHVTIKRARLCGISTTGEIDITPRGIGLNIQPRATDASLEQTYECLWDRPIRADARYDLSGDVRLPPSQTDPFAALSGQASLSSQNGRIYHASTLLKIFSVLNITELFTGGESDLKKAGYGYSEALIKARLADGKVHLDEILLDGNALKITGQGSIDLESATGDIVILAAPLKTVDRIVNKIPIFEYITAGSLISVPLRLHGKLSDLSVVPLPPAAVGKGLLRFMERTLKAPFKLVEGVTDVLSEHNGAVPEGSAASPRRDP